MCTVSQSHKRGCLMAPVPGLLCNHWCHFGSRPYEVMQPPPQGSMRSQRGQWAHLLMVVSCVVKVEVPGKDGWVVPRLRPELLPLDGRVVPPCWPQKSPAYAVLSGRLVPICLPGASLGYRPLRHLGEYVRFSETLALVVTLCTLVVVV